MNTLESIENQKIFNSFWKTTFPLIVVPILSIILFLLYVYFNHQFIDEIFDNTMLNKEFNIKIVNNEESVEFINYEKQLLTEDKKPFTFLLLGVDTTTVNRGRSDAIIYGIAVPKENQIYLLSIPRDSWVYSTASYKKDKLTHVYARGGIQSSISTIEQLLNSPIDYYAVIDFNGFVKLVDLFGGVDVDVKREVTYKDRNTGQTKKIYTGRQKLNGESALGYARFRGGPRGDFGRNDRQKEVVADLIQKAKDFKISQIDDILSILKNNFKTNMSVFHAHQRYKDFENINEIKIKELNLSKNARTGREGKMSVVYLDENELQKTIKEIHKILELPYE